MIRERRGVAGHARGSSADCGQHGLICVVRCGQAFSGGSLGQTKRRRRRLTDGIVNSRVAPAGYRAVFIAVCARERLRGRGAHPSAIAKSTAFNAVDLGCGSESTRHGE